MGGYGFTLQEVQMGIDCCSGVSKSVAQGSVPYTLNQQAYFMEALVTAAIS